MPYGFPLEIWDQVIDHSWSSGATLKACSLVCRAWLPSARLHLFHTVKLSPSLATKDPYALLRIAPLVRELALTACSIDLPQLDEPYLSILDAMRNVRKLVFQRLSTDWKSTNPHKFRTRISRLPPHFVRSIKSLELDYVMLPDLVYITDLLSFFHHTSELHISWVFLVDKTGANIPIEQLTLPPASMNVMEVSCNRFDTVQTTKLLSWLGMTSGMRCPKTLKLLINNFGHINLGAEQTLYSTIFRQAGPSLQHLWLTRNHWEDDSRVRFFFPPMDLSLNTNLVSLNLNCVYVKGQPSRWRHAWLDTIISSIRSNAVTRITIAMQHKAEYIESDLDALDWKVIDKALVHVVPFQTRFEAVVIRVRASQAEDDWVKRAKVAVSARLPRSRSAQIPIRIRCQNVKVDMQKELFPVLDTRW